MNRTILWCIGNSLLRDDGAGPALYSLLQRNPPEGLLVVNCETTPENFLSPLRRLVRQRRKDSPPILLLVADAAEMGLPGGAVRRMNLSDSENLSFSSHGIPLSLLLAPLLPRLEVVIFGIQPAFRGFGDFLSPEVAKSVEHLAELLRGSRWNELPPYQENWSPR
jgi:hydrogenase 3 maturation protease